MTDKKRTERTEKHTRALDNEIKKALEYWKEFYAEIDKLMSRYPQEDKMLLEQKEIVETTFKVFDLINRLQAEKQDLEIELKAMRGAANSYKAENEKLKKAKYIFANVDYCADDLEKVLKENEELKSAINGFRGYEDKIKAEAYKECIEKVKEKSKKTEVVCSGALVTMSYAISNKNLNNLLKELERDA